MKKIMYAVVLLLGLSMTNVSCSTSPEAQAKKDAKAFYKALEDDDEEAERKASQKSHEHARNYDMNGKPGEFERYRDAYAKYLEEYVSK